MPDLLSDPADGLLFVDADGFLILADDASYQEWVDCCCVETPPPSDCCCPQLNTLPLLDFTATVTGYLQGTSGVISGDLSQTCGVWPPTDEHEFANTGSNCDAGNPITTLSVKISCPNPDDGANGFQVEFAAVDGPIADCLITLTPVSATCDDGTGKIRLEYSYAIASVPLLSCPCDGQAGTLVIQEV